MTCVWFHITWNTYGSWLPGDPRGFRDHDHRVHSSGNYKGPPPSGEHVLLNQHARRLMSRSTVVIDPAYRPRVALCIVEKAERMGLEVGTLAVGATHVHLLVKLDPDTWAAEVGMIKRFVSHRCRDVYPGVMWSKRCFPRTVKDADQLRETDLYIRAHGRDEGAAVWRWDRGGGGFVGLGGE